MQVSKDNPRILVGASIPRSGHHFLADMMTAYYGSDIYYCEYYTSPSCCRAVLRVGGGCCSLQSRPEIGPSS